MKTNFLIYFFATILCSTLVWAADGVLEIAEGDVRVNGKPASVGQDIHESDVLKTGTQSQAKIVMEDSNEIDLQENSELKIEEYQSEDDGNSFKKVLLDLIFGQVRSQVNQKYDGEQNRYEVKTPAAVTGVRGTDFLVSHDAKSDESEVVSFSGEVEAGQRSKEGKLERTVRIRPGYFASARRGMAFAEARMMARDRFDGLRSRTRREMRMERREELKKRFENRRGERRQEFRRQQEHPEKHEQRDMRNHRQEDQRKPFPGGKAGPGGPRRRGR